MSSLPLKLQNANVVPKVLLPQASRSQIPSGSGPDGSEKIGGKKFSKAWWKAQVCLCGLKCRKWTIKEMQQVLLEAVEKGIEVAPEVEDWAAGMKRNYSESGKENKPLGLETNPLDKLKSNTDMQVSDELNHFPHRDSLPTVTPHLTSGDISRARQLEAMNRLHAALLASNSEGTTVFGTWQMDCPDIISTWSQCEDMLRENIIWKIHPPIVNDTHLWVQFKQIVVEGALRIEWKSALEVNRWRNRKNNFTFRGRETGESEIICDDEANNGFIVFTSSHECYGEFKCEFGGDAWPFTGKKIKANITGKKPYTLMQDYRRYERDWGKAPNHIMIYI